MRYWNIMIMVTVVLGFTQCTSAQKKDTYQPGKNNPYFSHTDTKPLNVSNEEWKKILPENVYYIARQAGTERAFTGKYATSHKDGIYYCAVCGNPLFDSDTKFDSGTGWPSFYQPISKRSVKIKVDRSGGMVREEVLCARCGSHLGHVFNDGPKPTGKRYCMNSAVLELEPKKKMTDMNNPYYSRTDTTELHVSDAEWEKILSPEVYKIAREKGTEWAFSGKYWDTDEPGDYYCAVCGNHLFRADAKFASSCGWPSFFETIRPGSVRYEEDNTHGMHRTEVLCGRCGSHLGHVFDDGPKPTGKRYCMNSAVLDFVPGKTNE